MMLSEDDLLRLPIDSCDSCQNHPEKVQGLLTDVMIKAAVEGHVTCLKAAIETGADVNSLNEPTGMRKQILEVERAYHWDDFCSQAHLYDDYEGDRNSPPQKTALIHALEQGHCDCVESLVELGADVNKTDTLAQTPLIVAAGKGSKRLVAILIQAGADVNSIQLNEEEMVFNRRTALMFASVGGHHKCVGMLLKAGADVNMTDSKESTALMEAADGGHYRCVYLLAKAGADVSKRNESGQTALSLASTSGDARCVKNLVKAGADVNNDGTLALVRACKRGHYGCTKYLIEAGADVNKCNLAKCFSLWNPQKQFIMKMLRLLLENGIKINITEPNALTTCLEKRYYTLQHGQEITMLLLASGENIDETRAEIPDYLKKPTELILLNICRESIRKHLLQMSKVNLFVRVPQLGLPAALAHYLLYHVSLQNDSDNEALQGDDTDNNDDNRTSDDNEGGDDVPDDELDSSDDDL